MLLSNYKTKRNIEISMNKSKIGTKTKLLWRLIDNKLNWKDCVTTTVI